MKQKKILFDIENFNQMGRKVSMLMGKDKKVNKLTPRKKSYFINCSKKNTFFKELTPATEKLKNLIRD
jgi:hypothetical protein